MLSLTEPAWIALPVREKLETKGGARHAIQRSRKDNIAIAKRCRCNRRIILLVIRTTGGVAVIIWRRDASSATTRSQCNAKAGVVVNGVAENSPSSVIASEAGNADAVEAVKRDYVPLTRAGAADYPIAR